MEDLVEVLGEEMGERVLFVEGGSFMKKLCLKGAILVAVECIIME